MNALYDLTASATVHHHACTSIVVQAIDGGIAHGRNLDYGLGKAMRAITVIVDWHSGGGGGGGSGGGGGDGPPKKARLEDMYDDFGRLKKQFRTGKKEGRR